LLEEAEKLGIVLSQRLKPRTSAVDKLFHMEKLVFTPGIHRPISSKQTVYEFLKRGETSISADSTGGSFGWLHIPANNVRMLCIDWAQTLKAL